MRVRLYALSNPPPGTIGIKEVDGKWLVVVPLVLTLFEKGRVDWRVVDSTPLCQEELIIMEFPIRPLSEVIDSWAKDVWSRYRPDVEKMWGSGEAFWNTVRVLKEALRRAEGRDGYEEKFKEFIEELLHGFLKSFFPNSTLKTYIDDARKLVVLLLDPGDMFQVSKVLMLRNPFRPFVKEIMEVLREVGLGPTSGLPREKAEEAESKLAEEFASRKEAERQEREALLNFLETISASHRVRSYYEKVMGFFNKYWKYYEEYAPGLAGKREREKESAVPYNMMFASNAEPRTALKAVHNANLYLLSQLWERTPNLRIYALRATGLPEHVYTLRISYLPEQIEEFFKTGKVPVPSVPLTPAEALRRAVPYRPVLMERFVRPPAVYPGTAPPWMFGEPVIRSDAKDTVDVILSKISKPLMDIASALTSFLTSLGSRISSTISANPAVKAIIFFLGNVLIQGLVWKYLGNVGGLVFEILGYLPVPADTTPPGHVPIPPLMAAMPMPSGFDEELKRMARTLRNVDELTTKVRNAVTETFNPMVAQMNSLLNEYASMWEDYASRRINIRQFKPKAAGWFDRANKLIDKLLQKSDMIDRAKAGIASLLGDAEYARLVGMDGLNKLKRLASDLERYARDVQALIDRFYEAYTHIWGILGKVHRLPRPVVVPTAARRLVIPRAVREAASAARRIAEEGARVAREAGEESAMVDALLKDLADTCKIEINNRIRRAARRAVARMVEEMRSGTAFTGRFVTVFNHRPAMAVLGLILGGFGTWLTSWIGLTWLTASFTTVELDVNSSMLYFMRLTPKNPTPESVPLKLPEGLREEEREELRRKYADIIRNRIRENMEELIGGSPIRHLIPLTTAPALLTLKRCKELGLADWEGEEVKDEKGNVIKVRNLRNIMLWAPFFGRYKLIFKVRLPTTFLATTGVTRPEATGMMRYNTYVAVTGPMFEPLTMPEERLDPVLLTMSLVTLIVGAALICIGIRRAKTGLTRVTPELIRRGVEELVDRLAVKNISQMIEIAEKIGREYGKKIASRRLWATALISAGVTLAAHGAMELALTPAVAYEFEVNIGFMGLPNLEAGNPLTLMGRAGIAVVPVWMTGWANVTPVEVPYFTTSYFTVRIPPKGSIECAVLGVELEPYSESTEGEPGVEIYEYDPKLKYYVRKYAIYYDYAGGKPYVTKITDDAGREVKTVVIEPEKSYIVVGYCKTYFLKEGKRIENEALRPTLGVTQATLYFTRRTTAEHPETPVGDMINSWLKVAAGRVGPRAFVETVPYVNDLSGPCRQRKYASFIIYFNTGQMNLKNFPTQQHPEVRVTVADIGYVFLMGYGTWTHIAREVVIPLSKPDVPWLLAPGRTTPGYAPTLEAPSTYRIDRTFEDEYKERLNEFLTAMAYKCKMIREGKLPCTSPVDCPVIKTWHTVPGVLIRQLDPHYKYDIEVIYPHTLARGATTGKALINKVIWRGVKVKAIRDLLFVEGLRDEILRGEVTFDRLELYGKELTTISFKEYVEGKRPIPPGVVDFYITEFNYYSPSSTYLGTVDYTRFNRWVHVDRVMGTVILKVSVVEPHTNTVISTVTREIKIDWGTLSNYGEWRDLCTSIWGAMVKGGNIKCC